MKRVVSTLVIIICVVFLWNLKVGSAFERLEDRMNYLETRVSELTSTQNDYEGKLKKQGTVTDKIEGILKRVKVGVGVRTVFSMTEDAAGTKTDGVSGGRSWNKDFEVDSMRLYFNAKVTDNITLEINTETHETDAAETNFDSIQLLDAFVEYTWNDFFHIRFGRHLPASDRYNLDGPYYLNYFDFPLTAQRYPNVRVGRVDGVSYWGQYGGGKFKWQFTASEGNERSGGSNDDTDNLQYSGRLTFNFWEPESGFYNSSTYYGKKDVLAIGLVMFHQSNGVGSATDSHDFNAWNIDFLLEKNFGWGTIDIEAAYFNYDNHGAGDSEPSQSDGSAWLAAFSYLFPEKVGWGKPQLVSRWQSFNPTNDVTTTAYARSKLELGMHYIIQDHNAKIALVWSNTQLGGSSHDDVGAVKLGMQFQH